MKRFFFFLMTCLCLSTAVMAVEPVCEYILVKQDSWGDGWNGCKLKFTDGDFTQEYTLENGQYGMDFIPYYGNEVAIEWTPGSYTNEVGFSVISSNGTTLLKHDFSSSFTNFPDTIKTSPCASTVNPDAPQNVKCELLSDRTMQTVWDPVSSASAYGVCITSPSGDAIVFAQDLADTVFVTEDPILKGGDYSVYVFSYDGSGVILGMTKTTAHLEIPIISEATVSVLVPSDCGMDVSQGVWMCWWVNQNVKETIVPMTAKGGNRFEAVIQPNDTRYNFYITNRPSAYESGAHYSGFQENVMAESFCGEVAYSDDERHAIALDDCSSVNHDFRLRNLTATPLSGDSVIFHWECDTFPAGKVYMLCLLDEYGHPNYFLANIPADTVSITDTLSVNVAEATTCRWGVIFGDHLGYTHYAYGPDFTTLGGGSFVPRNLKVTDNGDQTFTFTWEAPNDPNKWVAIINSTSTPMAGNIRSYTSPALSAGNYTFFIEAFDEDDNSLGYAYIYFCAENVTAFDSYLDIYIPDNAQMDSLAGGYALRWDYLGFETDSVVPLVPVGNNWYGAELLGLTKSNITFTVLNAPKEADATIRLACEESVNVNSSVSPFIVNRNDRGKRYVTSFSSSYSGYDYTPYNLQGTSADGVLTFTWESNETAPYYYISVYDENGNEIYDNGDDYDGSVSINLPTDTAMSVFCLVIPCYNDYGSYSSETAAWSDPISVQPSNLNPKNLQATLNTDGTYTISWSAPANRKVSYYYVEVIDHNGDAIFSDDVQETLSCNIGACPVAGTYVYYVYAVSSTYSSYSYGYAYSTFTVEGVEPHDITARVLIHPDSEYDTSGTLNFRFYDYVEDTWTSVAAVNEGENWYSATYTALTPGTAFRVDNDTYNSNSCNADACFELNRSYGSSYNYVSPVSCDAKAHDYRIIPGSLNATSIKGRVDLTWDAQDVTDGYYFVRLFDASGQFSTAYVYGEKSYSYLVPNSKDGQKITWSVRPYSQNYSYAEAQYADSITLAASEITIDNLKLSTKDSLTLDMSWSCDSASMDFLINVYCGGRICKIDTVVNDTSYHYAIPVPASYYFRVCPLDPANHGIVGQWQTSSSIYLYEASVPELVTNLQGSSDQLQLTFTWETSVSQVSASIYRYDEAVNNFNIWVADSVLTAKQWVLDVEIEGLYAIEIQPMIEVAPGQMETLSYYYDATTTAWTVKTYDVEISATEGGTIWPSDISGTYPDGFELSVETYPTDYNNYRFVGWSDGSTETDRLITIHSNIKLTAIYEKMERHHLSISATEGGKLYIDDMYGAGGYYTTYEHDYPYYGDDYVMYAYPEADAGYSFYQWSNGSKDYYFEYWAEKDTTLTAIFKPNCKLTVPNVVNGNVSVNYYISEEDQMIQKVYTVAYGSTVLMTANPASGYRFTGWNDGVMTLQREVILTCDSTIEASFAEAGTTPQYTVTFNTSGTDGKGGGYLNVSGTKTYYEGDILSLIATPSYDSRFVKWSDDVLDNPRTVTVSQDSAFTAIFAIKTFTLNITATEGGSVEISPAKPVYEYGDYVTVTATADEHNKFVRWSDGNTDNPRNFYVDENWEFQAIFEKEKFTITFLNEDSTFLDMKLWGYGETPTCEAPTKSSTAQYTYSFKGWNPEIEPVTKDQTYVATFNKSVRKYKVTFVDWDDTELKVQQVPYNTAAEAPENPTRPGYKFTGWDRDFSHVTSNMTVRAEYEVLQGIENVEGDEVQCTKVIRDGHIYIIRGDKTYTITGAEVNSK